MTKKNVLISSIARKIWMIKWFRKSFEILNDLESKIYTMDTDKTALGLFLSDKGFIAPKISDPSFLPFLKDICTRYSISIIIPTRDGELEFFSSLKEEIKSWGIEVLVAPIQVIQICRNKIKFDQFLEENNLPKPKNYNTNPSIPAILKPISGSGGKGIIKLFNEEDLRVNEKEINSDNYICQELITGKEYTIDVFTDFAGKLLTIVPRERIDIFQGESIKGVTVKDQNMIKITEELVKKIGLIGPGTLQMMKTPDNEYRIIELNPRFGGFCALSFEAGANSPLKIIMLLNKKELLPEIGKFKENLYMFRFSEDIYFNTLPDISNK